MKIRVVAPVLDSKELVEKARAEYQAAARAGVDISVVCLANGTRSISVRTYRGCAKSRPKTRGKHRRHKRRR